MTRAYYNELDPFAAAWLRALITAGHIAPGDVDDRSIAEVRPADLAGYTQCHFFAGIGVWSHALRSAGWGDARPVWTGSCPCQPFSAAGGQAGFDDARHLWPVWFDLIRECRPAVVFGEQVASPLGLQWLDIVSADVEGAGYAIGAADLGAASVGAPHIRQRLYFVADTAGSGRGAREPDTHARRDELHELGRGEACGLVNADDARPQGRRLLCADRSGDGGGECAAGQDGAALGLAHANGRDTSTERQQHGGQQRLVSPHGGADGLADTSSRGLGIDGGASQPTGHADECGPVNGVWRAADWVRCTDGKWRPVEPESFPLAHGAPARVGRLRGYGNGLCAPQATAFIEAYSDTLT